MRDEELLQSCDAGRAAGVTPSAIRRAARERRLRTAGRTRHGMLLFRAADVEEYRSHRIARLTRDLRAAAAPRDGEAWDEEQSSALDLAVETQERLEKRCR
jgi:hypothetical protein